MAQAAQEKLLRNYEGVIIIHPDASEEDQKALFRKNRDIVASFSGEINHLDTWGKRKLANPIEKSNRGFYFHTTFTATSGAIAELERTMRINDKVLRFKHLRLDDRVSLSKFVEDFKNSLTEAANREKEREAKFQARKAAGAAARAEGGGRGGDRDFGGGGGRGDRGDRGDRDFGGGGGGRRSGRFDN